MSLKLCFKCFVWRLVVSGGRVNLVAVTPTWPEAKVFDVFFFFKPVCFLKNPRRLPTQEKNMMGGGEAHIYVKTVSGSEESMRDTYRPPVEVERRRGLWWLIPRLSLEWWSEPRSRAGAGSKLNTQGSIVPGARREAKLLLNHSKLHLQIWKI